jgi:AraC-like DNA-binding protein
LATYKLLAKGIPFMLVDLEPSHARFRAFAMAATKSTVLALSDSMSLELRALGVSFARKDLSGEEYDRSLRKAVHHLANTFPQPPEMDERVRRMMRAVDHNPSITLTSLAREVGLSREHACRLFAGYAGVPFRAYVLSNKIRAAARHMGSTCSLTDVAIRSGFVDSSHFSKVWTKCYGHPPSAYFSAERVSWDTSALPAWIRPPLH